MFFFFESKEMEQEQMDYCVAKYLEVYQKTKEMLEQDARQNSKDGIISESKAEEIENEAQLNAIKKTIVAGREKYNTDVPFLWKCISRAHICRKSGVYENKIIDRVISAEQSWKAASGHAFEDVVKELGTIAMEGTNIKYIKQCDLSTLIREGKLGNSHTDLVWLERQASDDVFDVYVVAEDERTQKAKCFGCVQCKTSIRDRVSRDVVPSKDAMDRKFWSIGFVLNGEGFKTPKYTKMANGDEESEFKNNGWHGIYSIAGTETNDRIYSVDHNFEIVRKHTLKAYDVWFNDRMAFDVNWRADE